MPWDPIDPLYWFPSPDQETALKALPPVIWQRIITSGFFILSLPVTGRENWQTGVLTRHLPWQLEMMPQSFVEMSKELASEKGVKNGEKVKVSSARGEVLVTAIVTNRFKPFKIMNQTVHQVGLPWAFGWQYPEDGSGGDSANLLTPTIGDANTMIPETKAFMVNLEKIERG